MFVPASASVRARVPLSSDRALAIAIPSPSDLAVAFCNDPLARGPSTWTSSRMVPGILPPARP
eukprot:7973025-Alexandrium_andersonii.AAC.1